MLSECDDCSTAINELLAAEITVSPLRRPRHMAHQEILDDSVRIDCVLVGDLVAKSPIQARGLKVERFQVDGVATSLAG